MPKTVLPIIGNILSTILSGVTDSIGGVSDIFYHKGNDFAPHSMTNPTTPSPYVVTESDFSGPNMGFYVFNGNLSDGDCFNGNTANTAWIKLDLGVGNSKICHSYAIFILSLGLDITNSPKSWTLQGSNDDSNWDIISSQSGIIDWISDETKEFICDTITTPYRYFKMNITETVIGSPPLINELYFYEAVT